MKLREALWFFGVVAGISILAAALYQAARTPGPARSFRPALPEGVMIELEGPSRITSTQAGKLEWTMLSQGLKYYQPSELAAVDSPRAWIPVKDGGTVEVTGRSGEYFKGSEDILVRGGVQVELDKDARREWVVSGDTASYRKAEDAFYIGRLTAVMFPASGDTVRITAQNGRYDTGARTMTAARDVNCRWQNGMTLETEQIVYHTDTSLAATDRPVAITGQGFKLQGEGMVADLASKHIKIERKVGLRLEKGMKGLK
ncbi:MAG TPA: LPS export ABC transporter periplasmic protein LptC [bacterium]|nr:LPS export ABC transporter periplasmic protein LptC [bacterium]